MDSASIKNLDYEGLAHLLNKFMIRAIKGMGLSQDNFTDILRAKLDGIEAGANKYILPAASDSQLGGVKVGDNLSVDATGKISGKNSYTKNEADNLLLGKVDKVNGKQLSSEDFTSDEKQKLSGIAAGANNYVLPKASESQLGGVKVGDNLTVDATGKISGKNSYTKNEADNLLLGKVDKVNGKQLSSEDFTAELKAMLIAAPKPDVVQDLAGRLAGLEAIINNSGNEDDDLVLNKLNEVFAFLTGISEDAKLSAILSGKVDKVTGKQLSTEDFTTTEKEKLSGIAVNANNYVLPKATESQLGGVKVGQNLSVDSEGKISGKDSYTKTETDTKLFGKVDKVTGKQLSTEDFTTELKNRLLALGNYDDSSLSAEITALKNRLDLLVGSDNVTAIIDSFIEVENFLSGITNQETLTGLLMDLKEEIVAMFGDYVTLDGAQTIKGKKTFTQDVAMGAKKSFIGYLPEKAENTGGWAYAPLFVKDLSGNAFVQFGVVGSLNELGYIFIGANAYDAKTNLRITPAGTVLAKKLSVFDGTSAQFLKADGSVDSTAYWSPNGGVWNPNANILLGATDNGQEWSFDIKRNGKTGCYWHVWDSQLLTLLKINADDGKVSAPYGFVGSLSGTASYASDSDMLDGLHAASFYATKKLFSKADYQHYVVLLWKVNAKAYHRINGKLYTLNPGAARYQAANIDLWYSCWGSGLDKNFILNTFGLYTPWKLVTCTYNGEQWYALQHTSIMATTAYFVGTSDNIDFTAIHYYTSNTATVVNSEINNSIADKTSELSKPSVGSNAYALVSDTVANADKLDGVHENQFARFDGDARSESSDLFRFIGCAYKSNDSVWNTSGPAFGFGANANYHKLIQGSASENSLFITTCVNGTYTVWREFAFTDSNVASATKLNDDTEYKAWGKPFFKNGKPQNVSGDLTIDGKITGESIQIGDVEITPQMLDAGEQYKDDPIYKAAVRSSAIDVTLSTATPSGTYTPPDSTQIGLGYSMLSIILHHTNYANVQPYAQWGEAGDGRWSQKSGPLVDYPAFSGGPVIVRDKSGKLGAVGASGSGYYIYDPVAGTLTPINI